MKRFTSLDDEIRKEVEPFSSSVEERIEAAKKISGAGIKTVIFVSPIFPEISDWKGIIKQTKSFAAEYWFENLNIRSSNWGNVEKWLKKFHPDLLDKYKEIYFSKNDYWDKTEEEIKLFCRKNKIRNKIYFHHGT